METTVKEVFDAIEKNGYPQIMCEYIQYEYGTKNVIGACALGQAALNLGVEPEMLYVGLNLAAPVSIPREIFRMNDNLEWKIPEIVAELRRLFRHYLDYKVNVDETRPEPIPAEAHDL